MLNNTEIDNLSVMYEGDISRDASDKIRGFLFQDYITINCLLLDKVKYVCLEYLEDVDVFYNDDTFEFIQAKYYPSKSPKIDEISKDLYYQFLRLKMLNSGLKAKPCLYIYHKPDAQKPTAEDMKMYIGLGTALKSSVKYPANYDAKKWLKSNINTIKKKTDQQNLLFKNMASEESINQFIDEFLVCPQICIDEYAKDLKERLIAAYPNPDYPNDDIWKEVLFGLAISFIQERYISSNRDFVKLRFDKTLFDAHMTTYTASKNDQIIVSYLVGLVLKKYEWINRFNALSDFQIQMLNFIYLNTVKWIKDVGMSKDWQYKLVNTIGPAESNEYDNYKFQSTIDRLGTIKECRFSFSNFLGCLWKIMLDICQDNLKETDNISIENDLFNPTYYIVHNVDEYICMNFPDDKYINYSVIVPSGEPEDTKRLICSRMLNIKPKPQKWFFKNTSSEIGRQNYKYSTMDAGESHSVIDQKDDEFFIECMSCLKTDSGGWNENDKCRECIFSEDCPNGGK